MSDNTKLSKLQWRYFAAPEIPDILDDITGFIDDELLLPDGRCLNGVKFDFPEIGIINMYDIIDPVPAPLARTILTADFYADAPGKCFAGLGADWKWTFRFNNKMLINALVSCNSEAPIAPTNHSQELCFKAGRNQIVFEVFGGAFRHPGYMGGMDVAFKLLEEITALQILYPAIASFPDSSSNSMSIIFASNRPSPAAVEYRIKDSNSEWKRVYDNLGGQRRRDIAEHHIRLTGLLSDTVYEYRTVLLDDFRQLAEIVSEVQFFRTAPAPGKSFSFTATADLQNDEERRGYLQGLLGTDAPGKRDFFAFLGDLYWTSNFNFSVMEEFIMPYREITDNSLPLVMVRGNHEIYGKDSNRYFKFFSAPEPGREGYYMFSWGDVCFFVLDFCDDNPRKDPPSTRQFHDFEPYLEKEAQWLRNAVHLPMCRDAKYRIVLAHGIPVGDGREYMPKHVRDLIDPVFGGKDPQVKIHLWLGGHVHRPFRSIPCANSCYSMVDPVNFQGGNGLPPLGVNYSFPVVVTGGPSKRLGENMQFTSIEVEVTPDAINVRSCDRYQKEFDRFSIAVDGSISNECSSPEFKYYEY